MNKLFDVLEICLRELENGADLESVLARYSDVASELRPILKASVMARSMAVLAPSPDAVRRGRAKLLQQASEMREQKDSPRKRMIPIFQRLAISLSLSAVFLASGTGLVGASSTALPGEKLYPVKRSWEDLRLFFTFNPDIKEMLESEFESERLDEVGELLTEGRHEPIQFAGIFMQVNGVSYVSGVPVLVTANLQMPADGAIMIVTGRTNAQGFVEIESIEYLPEGAVVPVGNPVEVENESSSNSGSDSEEAEGPGSGNEAQGANASATPELNPQSFEMKGVVGSISNTMLIVNGQTFYLNNAKIDGILKPGANVEIKGYYAADGSFTVTEVKVRDSGSDSGGSSENSGSDSGSNPDSNPDSNSEDDPDSGDDNSGSGGGDDDDDGGDD
jgi:hypothetical protein